MSKKIDWGGLLLFFILIFFLIFGLARKYKRSSDSLFIYGISEGVKKGSRGTLSLHYIFVLNNIEYHGFVPEEFCSKCIKCCEIGDSVIVRYERDNPLNSDLVTSMPENRE